MKSIATDRKSSRSSRLAVLGVRVLAAGLVAGAHLWVASAAADEPPLVLSSEHLDMSADEIASAQGVVADEAPIVLRGPEPTVEQATPTVVESEFVSADGATTDAAPSAGGAITTFGQCVEGAIRGGVGFEDSTRVCRALFPDAR